MRVIIVEAYSKLDDEFVEIDILFRQLEQELDNIKPLTHYQRRNAEKLLCDLEVNLLREFRLMGVNKIHVLISEEMIFDAVSMVLKISGGR